LQGVQKGAASYAGGGTGVILNSLSNAQDNAMNAYNNVAATLEKNRLAVLPMEVTETNDVAQRKLDLQEQNFLQKMTQATDNVKKGSSNWVSGAEQFGQGIGDFYSGGGGM